MTTLIGVVSFGGIQFLELFLRGVQETLTESADVLVIVGRPRDTEMEQFLTQRNFRFISHAQNKGFAASLNDLMESAFVQGRYDNLIVCGNDTIPMKGCLDSLIQQAELTDWETISASEFDSRFLCERYPESRQYFRGPGLLFDDFSARPWELHADSNEGIEPDSMKDVRNMTLYKRSAFEKTGFADANFWPNGYFEDNDIGRRCLLAGVKPAGLKQAKFFHFWSRTIHQNENRDHGKFFGRNQEYYVQKWGGLPHQEHYELPFHGDTFQLSANIFLPGKLKIDSRNQEQAIINYWSRT